MGLADDMAGFFDEVFGESSDALHEAYAEGLADEARRAGLSTADTIELTNATNPQLPIDMDRVRSRANEILASDQE